MLTHSTPSSDRLPLLTRCLVSRVRLLALEAQVAAGGPPRRGQLERAVEHLAGGQVLPATASPIGGPAAARPRAGRVAGESHSARCCSSEKENEKKTEKDPHSDKMEETRLLLDEFDKKETVAQLRRTLAENAARWKAKLAKQRSRKRGKRKTS